MSIRGFFEVNTRENPDELIVGIRRLGFPAARIEESHAFGKRYGIDLQASERPDKGTTEALKEDLVRVARFLIAASMDGEVWYSRDLDLRDPGNPVTIYPEELRSFPPSLSGLEAIYVVRER